MRPFTCSCGLTVRCEFNVSSFHLEIDHPEPRCADVTRLSSIEYLKRQRRDLAARMDVIPAPSPPLRSR